MGAKMTPTMKKSGSTVLGVRMGCHAFNRCWRNAVSAASVSQSLSLLLLGPSRGSIRTLRTRWSPALGFLLIVIFARVLRVDRVGVVHLVTGELHVRVCFVGAEVSWTCHYANPSTAFLSYCYRLGTLDITRMAGTSLRSTPRLAIQYSFFLSSPADLRSSQLGRDRFVETPFPCHLDRQTRK